MEKDFDKINNRIWITERCHMKAEKRSRFLDLYFHIVLALFALASIGVAIMSHGNVDLQKSNVLTFTSISTLCLSLLVFGFKFGETAANHRSCYLSLQKLRADKHRNALSLEKQFIEILAYYPNHTYGDYMRLAVSNILKPNQNLESPPGNKVSFSRWERVVYASGWLLARLALFSFAITPFAVIIYGTDFFELPSVSP